MIRKKRMPPGGSYRPGGKKGKVLGMKPYSYHITSAHKSKAFFRSLVVRAIEDAAALIYLFAGVAVCCAMIAAVCLLFRTLFRWLGVA